MPAYLCVSGEGDGEGKAERSGIAYDIQQRKRKVKIKYLGTEDDSLEDNIGNLDTGLNDKQPSKIFLTLSHELLPTSSYCVISLQGTWQLICLTA